jgi:preprotein translocase subunit SecG
MVTARYRMPPAAIGYSLAVIVFLSLLLIAASLLLVLLVLLHRGKGGGLSSMFGGSFYSSMSGSSVVERNLDRLTIIAGLVWLVTIVGLGLLYKNS